MNETTTPEQPSISGLTDPAGEAPWAMQLVVHAEKSAPPTRTAVCAAAATAVVTLLADDRAHGEGSWAPLVERWLDGRIRKHCRRARGAAWDRVEALEGVTVEVAGAQVRAFPPAPTNETPKGIAKLQLSGGELLDPDVATQLDPSDAAPVVVSISPEPFLPLGKAAAAAGHAAQVAAMRMPAEQYEAWRAAGFPVAVEHPDAGRWEALRATSPVEIVDAGFTVVEPGTCTALARWS